MLVEKGYYESLLVDYDIEWSDGRGEIQLGATWVSFNTVRTGVTQHTLYSKNGDKITDISKFRLPGHYEELKQLVKDIPEAEGPE